MRKRNPTKPFIFATGEGLNKDNHNVVVVQRSFKFNIGPPTFLLGDIDHISFMPDFFGDSARFTRFTIIDHTGPQFATWTAIGELSTDVVHRGQPP